MRHPELLSCECAFCGGGFTEEVQAAAGELDDRTVRLCPSCASATARFSLVG